MPIAHPCNQCGLDLALVRPVRLPALNLPVVSCPRCQWSVVRRRGRNAIPWAAPFRFCTAGIMLMLNLFVFTITLYVTFGSLSLISGYPKELPATMMIGFTGVVVGIIPGLACSIFLMHLRPFMAWFFWLVSVLAVLALTIILILIYIPNPDVRC